MRRTTESLDQIKKVQKEVEGIWMCKFPKKKLFLHVEGTGRVWIDKTNTLSTLRLE